MTMHWQDMNTNEKIQAIRSVWYSGISMSKIAACFDGANRHAVAGMYNRHKDKLADCPLNAQGTNSGRPRTRAIKVARKPIARPRRRMLPLASESYDEPPERTQEPWMPAKVVNLVRFESPSPAPESRFVPIAELRAHECRYAVNEAGIGETHLFCGAPCQGSWCDHHAAIVYRPTGEVNSRGIAA